MAVKVWQTLRMRYCDKPGKQVALQVEMIYPAEHLPDMPPRAGLHRCSYGQYCMKMQRGACRWSGGNPDYDPFSEKEL